MPEPRGPLRALPTSIWLDEPTREILDDLCDQLDMSRSEVMREAIRRMSSNEDHSAEIRRLVAKLSKLVSS